MSADFATRHARRLANMKTTEGEVIAAIRTVQSLAMDASRAGATEQHAAFDSMRETLEAKLEEIRAGGK